MKRLIIFHLRNVNLGHPQLNSDWTQNVTIYSKAFIKIIWQTNVLFIQFKIKYHKSSTNMSCSAYVIQPKNIHHSNLFHRFGQHNHQWMWQFKVENSLKIEIEIEIELIHSFQGSNGHCYCYHQMFDHFNVESYLNDISKLVFFLCWVLNVNCVLANDYGLSLVIIDIIVVVIIKHSLRHLFIRGIWFVFENNNK